MSTLKTNPAQYRHDGAIRKISNILSSYGFFVFKDTDKNVNGTLFDTFSYLSERKPDLLCKKFPMNNPLSDFVIEVKTFQKEKKKNVLSEDDRKQIKTFCTFLPTYVCFTQADFNKIPKKEIDRLKLSCGLMIFDEDSNQLLIKKNAQTKLELRDFSRNGKERLNTFKIEHKIFENFIIENPLKYSKEEKHYDFPIMLSDPYGLSLSKLNQQETYKHKIDFLQLKYPELKNEEVLKLKNRIQPHLYINSDDFFFLLTKILRIVSKEFENKLRISWTINLFQDNGEKYLIGFSLPSLRNASEELFKNSRYKRVVKKIQNKIESEELLGGVRNKHHSCYVHILFYDSAQWDPQVILMRGGIKFSQDKLLFQIEDAALFSNMHILRGLAQDLKLAKVEDYPFKKNYPQQKNYDFTVLASGVNLITDNPNEHGTRFIGKVNGKDAILACYPDDYIFYLIKNKRMEFKPVFSGNSIIDMANLLPSIRIDRKVD